MPQSHRNPKVDKESNDSLIVVAASKNDSKKNIAKSPCSKIDVIETDLHAVEIVLKPSVSEDYNTNAKQSLPQDATISIGKVCPAISTIAPGSNNNVGEKSVTEIKAIPQLGKQESQENSITSGDCIGGLFVVSIANQSQNKTKEEIHTHGLIASYNMFDQWMSPPGAPDSPHGQHPPGGSPSSYYSPYFPPGYFHYQYAPPSSPVKCNSGTSNSKIPGSGLHCSRNSAPQPNMQSLHPYPASPYPRVKQNYPPQSDFHGLPQSYRSIDKQKKSDLVRYTEEVNQKWNIQKSEASHHSPGCQHIPSYRYSGTRSYPHSQHLPPGYFPAPMSITESFDSDHITSQYHERDGDGQITDSGEAYKSTVAAAILNESSYQPASPNSRNRRYDNDGTSSNSFSTCSALNPGYHRSGGEYYGFLTPYRADVYRPCSVPSYYSSNYDEQRRNRNVPPSEYYHAPGSHGPPQPPHRPSFYVTGEYNHKNEAYYRATTPHSVPPQQDEVHPLLRDYDRSKDRRLPSNEKYNPDNSADSPNSRVSGKSSYTTPERKRSGKARNSGSLSSSLGGTPGSCSTLTPTKKTSTAAQAAITAGMTQPPSASEIDFDIHCPPLEPVLPPSSEAVCTIPSSVNVHDVLCGRGGGTNTQIGNRRFRSLVQEFQPTYLLCRRKEKPLIARTIVLIIRNRGGRFLKKNETSGMLFEVGDEKAEAKTSQALREGLDVRATKTSTLLGKKKHKNKSKEIQSVNDRASAEQGIGMSSHDNSSSNNYDVTMTDSSPGQRDGPLQRSREYNNDSAYYYHGYGYDNPNYHYVSEPKPLNTPSPSRKRQRGQPLPPLGLYHYAIPPKGHPYSSTPAYIGGPHAQGLPTATSTEEDTSVWAMDFSPPKSKVKKDDEYNIPRKIAEENEDIDMKINVETENDRWSAAVV